MIYTNKYTTYVLIQSSQKDHTKHLFANIHSNESKLVITSSIFWQKQYEDRRLMLYTLSVNHLFKD